MLVEYDLVYMTRKSHDKNIVEMFGWDRSKKDTLRTSKDIFANHVSGHMTTRQIQRLRYLWMTMEKDYVEYVRKCHKLQVYSDKINAPSTLLFNMTTS